MNRIDARKNALKLVYEWQMGGVGGEETIQGMLKLKPDEPEYDFMVAMVNEVCTQTDKWDDVITQYLKGWSIDRLSRVDLAILRIAICELQRKTLPTATIINEAVELAREFSTEKAGAFINGVLGNYARDLQLQ